MNSDYVTAVVINIYPPSRLRRIMPIFTQITTDLRNALRRDLAQIKFLLRKNPAMGYTRIVEIGKEVGRRYGINLVVNFPKEGRINEFEMYGRRDLSLIIDYERRQFPVGRDLIKEKASSLLGSRVKTQDAYMYDDKEGVRVYTDEWKIDILPHSLHIWTEFDEGVTKFCDWLLENVYVLGLPHDGIQTSSVPDDVTSDRNRTSNDGVESSAPKKQ